MEVFGAWADGNMYPSREIAVGARDAVNHTAQYHKFGHSQCKQLVSRRNCTALDYGVNLKQQSPNPVRPQCKALLMLNDTGDFQKVHTGLVSKRRHPSIVGIRRFMLRRSDVHTFKLPIACANKQCTLSLVASGVNIRE